MGDAEPIRVWLTVEGGFAGLAPRAFAIDASRLPETTAAELRTELQQACRPELPETALSGTPDVFVYRLGVTGEITVGPLTFDDVTASPELRSLVARVQELAADPDSCG